MILIENSEIIENHFGYFPSFHDSEVISVRLDREEPSIAIEIYVFESSEEIDNEGHYKYVKECIVDFIFNEVKEMKISDFNHQNVLYGIKFKQEADQIMTKFDSSFGMNGYIQSSKVSVKGLKPLKE